MATDNRRDRSDSPDSMVEAMQAAARGVRIPPSLFLRDGDRPFWDAIVGARMANEWADVDLVHVANLARTMADIESASRRLDAEGPVLKNDKGTQIPNPLHAVLRELSGRSLALTRILQLHAAVKVGKIAGMGGTTGSRTEDAGARKGAAMAAAAALKTAEDDDDDLLARPIAH